MDDLYDNLENYNEANQIQELRNENQELKAKMEKYAVTLEKLQKDFDNLAAEYKKLEMNYSSLLKTARAEIERKTQIITNLNTEKDMMVLNAIQNKNFTNVRRNWRTGANFNQNPKGNEMDYNKNPAGNQADPRSSSTGRKEHSQTPPEDSSIPVNAQNANRTNVTNEKCERASDVKENVREVERGRPPVPASIKSRRKSLPATRMAKFSSDEDDEDKSLAVDRKRKESASRESNTWRNSERNYNKHNRPPDHDSFNRNRNYDYNDKYRNKDRFESQRHRYSPERFHYRSRRDFSGDRRYHRDVHRYRDGSGGYKSDKDGFGEQRIPREVSGDHRPFRDRLGDCGPGDGLGDHKPNRDHSRERYPKPDPRKRRLESPHDKYHEYEQKNHEQFERDYYDERNKHLEDAGNPKYLSDYEEPSYKRMRTDSYHRTDQDRCYRGKGIDHAPQPVVEIMQFGDMSCQSPDYLWTDLTSVPYKPKEIKVDAEVQMDDPREHSDKYTIRTENGEKVLRRIADRSVDLKVVTKWSVQKVKMPPALMRRPSECSDSVVNDVYGSMDIDDAPVSDISSIESGETVGSVTTDPFYYKHHKNDVYIKSKIGNPNSCENTNHIEKVVEDRTSLQTDTIQKDKIVDNPQNYENNSMQAEKLAEKLQTYENADIQVQVEKVAEKLQTYENADIQVQVEKVAEKLQTYENANIQMKEIENIPKNTERETEKHVRNTNSEKETEQKQKLDDETNTKESFDILKNKYKIPKLKNTDTDQPGHCEKKQTNNKNFEDRLQDDDKHTSASKIRATRVSERNNDQLNVVVTGKGMVEGDLELSDENSDNIDLMTRVMTEIEHQTSFELIKPNVVADGIDKDSKNQSTESSKDKSINNNATEKDVALRQEVEEKNTSESHDTSKNFNSKKKTTKHKTAKEIFSIPEKDDASDKLTKTKIQDTVVSKEIKNKFCDLFGDTSSLITPEDLGLTAQEVRIESSSSNYFPIFEDAQDAIDVTDHAKTALSALSAVTLEEAKVDQTNLSKNTEQEPRIDINEKKTKHSKGKEKEVLSEKPSIINESKPKSKLDKTEPNPSKNIEQEQRNHTNIDKNYKKTKHSKGNEKDVLNEKSTVINESKPKPKLNKCTEGKSEIEFCKNREKEQHFRKKLDEPKTKICKNIDNQQCIKMDIGESNTKSKPTKVAEKECHSVEPLDTNDVNANEIKQKSKSTKNIQKEKCSHTKTADETKTKPKTSKSTETVQHSNKVSGVTETSASENIDVANTTKPKAIEIRKRKSRKHEEKPQIIEASELSKPPVVTAENINSAQPTSDEPNVVKTATNEPEIVKTVIISSGIQPLCVGESLPANIISPILEHPVTPNIDHRETRSGIPLLTHSVHIHALATSTPAKEVPVEETRTPDISNTSNDQTSLSSNAAHNNDAPDVRIFVKRRRRVIKNTPSKA